MERLNTKYIKPKKAWKKLTTAYEIMQPTCICGATGFGKTELAKQFLGKRAYDYISCAECPNIDPEKFFRSGIAVIDDLHMLSDKEKQRELTELLKRGDIWVIMLSRSKIPSWLIQSCIELGIMIISENDLKLSSVDMFGYFSDMGTDISPDEISTLCRRCDGNALVLKYCAAKLAEGIRPGDELDIEVKADFREYLNNAVIPGWNSEVTDMLMKMSIVDEFTLPMAEKITGNPFAAQTLKQAVESGNFISQDNGVYTIRKIMLEALRERAVRTFGTEKYNAFLLRAGMWYESNGQENYRRLGVSGKAEAILTARNLKLL